MHPTGVTDKAEWELSRPDAVAELEAVRDLVAAVNKVRSIVEPWMPEQMHRIVGIASQYCTPNEQTRKNTENAILILAGLNGYAEMHTS